MDLRTASKELDATGAVRRGPADRQAALLARFRDAGYAPIETPILGPASVFLDFSGEEIRSALFLTSDGAGTELCLRPEYTIPVCRAYLASDAAGRQAAYSYCGPVFRSRGALAGRGQESSEAMQAGLESFGRPDIAAADAEILALALDAAADAGFVARAIKMGDAGLLSRLFAALDMPPNWQRRLKRGLDKGRRLDDILTEAPSLSADHSGVLAAITGTDQKGARALVEDLLSIAGIATVGGRSPAEIADRFLAQVASKATPGFSGERKEILERFLGVECHPDAASRRLRDLASSAKLDLAEALDLFDERANFIAALGIEDLTFQASFGRNLDYYTGFVFEARHRNDPSVKAAASDVVIGGGRYDRLAQALGSREPIEAVGAALWVDRLARTERVA